MTDFLRTMILINAYVACTLTMFCLLVAPPARADDDAFSNAVVAVVGFVAEAMDTGGDDE